LFAEPPNTSSDGILGWRVVWQGSAPRIRTVTQRECVWFPRRLRPVARHAREGPDIVIENILSHESHTYRAYPDWLHGHGQVVVFDLEILESMNPPSEFFKVYAWSLVDVGGVD